MKGQLLTVTASRGGCGKTSTAGTLAHLAARDGLKVLLIDMDSQSTLTLWEDADPQKPGIYEVLAKKYPLEAVIQEVKGLDFIPGSGDLIDITTKTDSLRELEDALAPVRKKYDLICIDTPPNIGQLQNIALYASSGILLALESDTASLQGLYNTASQYEHLKQLGSKARPVGIVVTRYEKRPKLSRLYLEILEEKGQEVGFPVRGTIRKCIAVPESCATCTPLPEYAPKSNACLDYEALWAEIYKKGRLNYNGN